MYFESLGIETMGMFVFFWLFMSLQAPSLGSSAWFTTTYGTLKARFEAMPSHAVVFMLRMPYMYMRLRDEGGHTADIPSGLGKWP